MCSEERDETRVTIGVCVRNGASTLPQTIRSIMQQDFPHKFMEVIFVDDGSEDSTLKIVRSYINRMGMRVRIFHQEWKGLGSTRNVVVDNASGSYIVWIDADTTIPKDHVRKQVEFLQDNRDVGIAKARFGLLPHQSVVATLELVSFAVYDLRNYSLESKLPGTAGAIYRVEAIRGVGGFDNSITRGGEDMDAAERIKAVGWLLSRSPTVFYEHGRATWKGLWQQYSQRGYAIAYLYRRNKRTLSIYRMNPIASFLNGACCIADAHRIVAGKAVFLLPFHFAFKMSAWCIGFARGSYKYSQDAQ